MGADHQEPDLQQLQQANRELRARVTKVEGELEAFKAIPRPAAQFASAISLADHREVELQELRRVNAQLEERVHKVEDQLGAMKNTVSMLLAGQNGHTATLESHRLLFMSRDQASSRHSSVFSAPSPSVGFIPAPVPTPDSVYGADLSTGPTLGLDSWPEEMFNMTAFDGHAEREVPESDAAGDLYMA